MSEKKRAEEPDYHDSHVRQQRSLLEVFYKGIQYPPESSPKDMSELDRAVRALGDAAEVVVKEYDDQIDTIKERDKTIEELNATIASQDVLIGEMEAVRPIIDSHRS